MGAHRRPAAARPARWPAGGLLALMLAVTPLAGASQDDPKPAATATEIVSRFQAQVQRHAGEAPDQETLAAMTQCIHDTHDMDRIARMVLGRHWSDLAPEQRREFTQSFAELSAATWLSRFAGAAGVEFVIEDESIDATRARVSGAIVSPDGRRTPLSYQLAFGERGWRIINILADGVSDLALRRSQYDAWIRAQGFDSLLAELRQRTTAQIGM